MCVLPVLFLLSGPPVRAETLEAELAAVEAERWAQGLDASAYPESPYTSPELLPQAMEIESC
jgi:hypothetical protein